MALTDAQTERYSRQIILPELGGRGQQQLLRATALLSGGGPAFEVTLRYLVAAGVGHILLNQRLQTFEGDTRVDLDALQDLNPDSEIRPFRSDDASCSPDIVVMCEGTPDAFEEMKRIARQHRAPMIIGASSNGSITTIPTWDDETACFRCMTAGSDVATPCNATLIGSLIAAETIRVLLSLEKRSGSRKLVHNATTGMLLERRIDSQDDCRTCATQRDAIE